jgi:4-amino-4-deoxy-L-arabinose transferase-like glycosyltransferase
VPMENADRVDVRVAFKLDSLLDTFSRHPLSWVVLIWMLFVLPAIFVRGAYFEESTIIGLARGALEDGWWLSPHLYGQRLVERPVLLSWLVAALSWPVGSILVPIARLPSVVSGLAGAVLIYAFVKPYTSPAGRLVAALCFVTSPAAFQAACLAEPDFMLSVIMFAAFTVWWTGEERDGPTIARWLAVSLLLTAAGLAKGPQPLAFFYIGVFAYYLLRRKWKGVLGLVCCGIIPAAIIGAWYVAVYQPGDLVLWRANSRLYFPGYSLAAQLFDYADFATRFIVVVLPSAIVIAAGWRPETDQSIARKDLLAALLLYALPCTVLLWLWPGAHYRYAMPAVPALAAAAGILFDQLRARESRARYVALSAMLGLGFFQIAVNWLAIANFPDLFAESRVGGREIAAVMSTKPAPLYAAFGAGDNAILVYLPPPIRRITAWSQATVPAWALATAEQISALRTLRPDLDMQLRLVLHEHGDAQLLYIDKR